MRTSHFFAWSLETGHSISPTCLLNINATQEKLRRGILNLRAVDFCLDDRRILDHSKRRGNPALEEAKKEAPGRFTSASLTS